MNIVVCMKQVPDTNAPLVLAPGGLAPAEDGTVWVANPHDEVALEAALRLREAHGGRVTVIAAGPARVEAVLRAALAAGADEAALMECAAPDDAGVPAVARALAAACRRAPFDLVLCGEKSVDTGSGLTGAALAHALGIPHAASVMAFEVEAGGGALRVRSLVDGKTLVLRVPLPALLTVRLGCAAPRYSTVAGILAARRKPLARLSPAGLGLEAATLSQATGALRVLDMTPRPPRKGARIVSGETPAEKARELVRLLREEARIL